MAVSASGHVKPEVKAAVPEPPKLEAGSSSQPVTASVKAALLDATNDDDDGDGLDADAQKMIDDANADPEARVEALEEDIGKNAEKKRKDEAELTEKEAEVKKLAPEIE